MIVYQPSVANDLLLARWWGELHSSGEIQRMLMRDAHTLSGFMRMLQSPTILVLDTDEQGIWFAMWFEPIMSGAFVGVWIAERARHTKTAYDAVQRAHKTALQTTPILIAITKQEKLLDEFERFGYDRLCRIPRLFDGEDAWVLALTLEGLNRGD